MIIKPLYMVYEIISYNKRGMRLAVDSARPSASQAAAVMWCAIGELREVGKTFCYITRILAIGI